MEKAVITDKKSCLFHRWKLVRILENAEYSECTNCSARKVILTGDTFHIRWEWLQGRTQTLKRSPVKKEVDNG